MKEFTTLLLITTLVSCGYSQLLALIPEQITPLDDTDCKDVGQDCLDDDTLIVCAKTTNGFKEISKYHCSSLGEGFCCDTAKKNCDTTACGIDNNGIIFMCTEPGIFPHPTNCSAFFYCDQNLNMFEGNCDGSFNATAEMCEAQEDSDFFTIPKLATATCNEPEDGKFNCDNPTVKYQFPDSPQYYVFCLPGSNFTVTVEKCPGSQVFDPTLQICTSAPLKCDAAHELLPSPDDCHKYYNCTEINTPPILETCPSGQGFDPQIRSCLPENFVSSCRGSSTVPSTTSSTTSSITSSTTTTTTTTTEATTTRSTTSTTSSPPAYTCSSIGDYPDPKDCHSYYECIWGGNNNIVYKHVNCPPGYHFIGYCTPGEC